MKRSILDMQCNIAEMVHEKFLKESYKMSACESDFDGGEIEELRLLIGLKKSGICCPERKEKLKAAISVPQKTMYGYSTTHAVVFNFVQPTPAGTWVIAHNLGYNPPVECIDTRGNPIAGSVVYLDLNTLQIIFPFIIGGTAHLYNG